MVTKNEAISEAERSVIRLLDRDAIVETACDLIAIPSLPAQERAAQEYVSQFLGQAGATVDVWTIDCVQLARHPAFSAERERSDPLGVVGDIGSRDGAVLLIDGHVDVVPTGNENDWTSPPFEPAVRDGVLYGRGACDTKGGLAAALHAMGAISASGVELAGRIRLTSVVGEEDGGSGTLAALLHGVTGDGCIVLEPTELCIAPAVAGALSFRVRVKGRSTHGALRSEGVSAIERLPVVLEGLQELERLRNARLRDPLFEWARTPFAICVGRVAGGDWPSSVADWVTLEGRYGVAPSEDLDDARAELELAVAEAALRDPWLTEVPPTVEWWGGRFLPGRTEPSDRVVTTLLGAHEKVTGQRPLVRGMPYGCDLGLTNSVGGIPSVVYGPGDVRDAHRPDEHVAVDDLVTAARVLAITALRYCGVASP